MACFTECSDWFVSKRFLYKLIVGYFRQNNVNMTDVSTIVAQHCFIESNPSFTMKTLNNTQLTLFVPTNDADGNMFFSNQTVKIGMHSNEWISGNHLGLIGIHKQNKHDILETINCMKKNKLHLGVFFKTLHVICFCNLYYL